VDELLHFLITARWYRIKLSEGQHFPEGREMCHRHASGYP
jgi:hypothetical protein